MWGGGVEGGGGVDNPHSSSEANPYLRKFGPTHTLSSVRLDTIDQEHGFQNWRPTMAASARSSAQTSSAVRRRMACLSRNDWLMVDGLEKWMSFSAKLRHECRNVRDENVVVRRAVNKRVKVVSEGKKPATRRSRKSVWRPQSTAYLCVCVCVCAEQQQNPVWGKQTLLMTGHAAKYMWGNLLLALPQTLSSLFACDASARAEEGGRGKRRQKLERNASRIPRKLRMEHGASPSLMGSRYVVFNGGNQNANENWRFLLLFPTIISFYTISRLTGHI